MYTIHVVGREVAYETLSDPDFVNANSGIQ